MTPAELQRAVLAAVTACVDNGELAVAVPAEVTVERPKVKGKDLEKLKDKVDGDPYQLLSPYPGLKSAVSLQAWAEQLFVDSVNDDRIDEFLELFTSGPQTELTGERGAPCSGTTAPRPLDTTPTPAPSASASPTASAAPSPTASK